ncbi:MAG: hypothetical protein AABY22_08140, partial [Nanoarchaeota archaeon]
MEKDSDSSKIKGNFSKDEVLKSHLSAGAKEIVIPSENLKSDFKEEEEKVRQQFYAGISNFVEHPKYAEILATLQVVLDSSKINGFILDGDYAIGKSTIIKSYLKQKKHNFVYINSYATSLAFYIEANKNKDNIILIDDLAGIWKDNKGISILRALLNNEKNRYIHYESTSEKLKVSSSFIFTGKIIILCNNINKLIDEALLSRVIYRRLNFNYAEKLEMIEKIINYNYKLKQEQTQEIITFISANMDETCLTFSFRTLL